MSTQKVPLVGVIEHLLLAIRFKPPGGQFSFLWDPRNPRSVLGTRGYNFYIDHDEIERGALELLNEQAQLLEGTPLDEAQSILLDFFRFNLQLFDDGALMFAFRQFEKASEFVHLDRSQLGAALLNYVQEIRQTRLYLIPAKRLALSQNYVGSRILLLRPTEDLHEVLPKLPFSVPPLKGLQFPPFSTDEAEGQIEEQDSWLGCLARSDQQGYNLLEALLGAISLILPPLYSHAFSMAERIPYIYCVGGRWIARLDGPTFPPLISDHRLEQKAIDIISSLLESTRTQEDQQRIEIGLQFVGAGWEPPSRLSFLHNAIAFDAFFGEQRRVGASIRSAVSKLAPTIAGIEDRIARLLKIRNELLHGEIVAVEASREYLVYYDTFKCDPQEDQVNILRACVRALSGVQ